IDDDGSGQIINKLAADIQSRGHQHATAGGGRGSISVNGQTSVGGQRYNKSGRCNASLFFRHLVGRGRSRRRTLRNGSDAGAVTDAATVAAPIATRRTAAAATTAAMLCRLGTARQGHQQYNAVHREYLQQNKRMPTQLMKGNRWALQSEQLGKLFP